MSSVFHRSPWSDHMLAMLRIVAGVVFLSHGTTKLFGYPASPSPMPPIEWTSQLGVAGMLEVVGGLLIVVGLLTRPVAFVLSGEMAVAYFQAHAPRSLFPTVNNGEPAVLYCFLFLYLAAAGAGAWSIDRLIARGRSDVHVPDVRVADAPPRAPDDRRVA